MKNIENEAAQEAAEIQDLLAEVMIAFKRGKKKGLIIMTVDEDDKHKQYVSSFYKAHPNVAKNLCDVLITSIKRIIQH